MRRGVIDGRGGGDREGEGEIGVPTLDRDAQQLQLRKAERETCICADNWPYVACHAGPTYA